MFITLLFIIANIIGMSNDKEIVKLDISKEGSVI